MAGEGVVKQHARETGEKVDGEITHQPGGDLDGRTYRRQKQHVAKQMKGVGMQEKAGKRSLEPGRGWVESELIHEFRVQ